MKRPARTLALALSALLAAAPCARAQAAYEVPMSSQTSSSPSRPPAPETKPKDRRWVWWTVGAAVVAGVVAAIAASSKSGGGSNNNNNSMRGY